MKTIDLSHFIERYIAGEMNEEEMLWFEKELEGNEDLQAEVDLRRKTDVILQKQDVLTLRNKLVAIEKQRKEKEIHAPSSSSPRLGYVKYAAVLAVVATIGSVVFFNGRHTANDELISKYYKTYEPPARQRAANSIFNGDFELAMEFYNSNDYANAANLFRKVVDQNPKDMQSVLLHGVSSFEDKRYPDARKSFVTVIDDNNNLFIETARWYLALCYIKTNENGKASEQLKKIITDGGLYSKNAKKILKSLN